MEFPPVGHDAPQQGQGRGRILWFRHPTKQAFDGGGYETTFAPMRRMAPETGDLIASG